MIKEHDRVVLTDAIAEEALVAGDVGTVVHVYADEAAYEVEFFTLSGETAAVATVHASQVRETTERDLVHARVLAVA